MNSFNLTPAHFFAAGLNLRLAKKKVNAWRYRLVWAIVTLFLFTKFLFLFLLPGESGAFVGMGTWHLVLFVFICGAFISIEMVYKKVQDYFVDCEQVEPDWIKYCMVLLENNFPIFLILLTSLREPLGHVLEEIPPP
ncbi:MAG: hypothetical protein EXR99_11755 [Gemmataceae bacterium]|nr:hypothetical protein [Gemmataceae bacterium]